MTKLTIPWNETFDKNKMYIWISEKGEHTCDECKSLNGKIFFGDKIPPRPHPNCKCEVVEMNAKNLGKIENANKYANSSIEKILFSSGIKTVNTFISIRIKKGGWY